jgi:DNA-binding NtrC family response regulator
MDASGKMKVLIVDDEKLLRWSIAQKLLAWGYTPVEASTGKEGLRLFRSTYPDLILLDLRLPDEDGMDLLQTFRSEDPDVPIVVITAYGSVDEAVQAMKRGADDFMTKPLDFTRLQVTLERLLENVRLKRKIQTLEAGPWTLEAIIAESPAMRAIVRDLRRIVTTTPSSVLITGESGTGKDLLARVLHYSSDRALGPFVVIDCTAIPETLIESELFGYERGAFTDAKTSKKGAFLLANGGTLVLDEIGEMRPALQAKLLRVLEDRAFRPLGGTMDISVNVCVVATTNRNLEEAVRRGEFRSDLYYRLNVVRIHIPPLRERKEDILPLAMAFVRQFNAQFRRHVQGFTEEAAQALLQHPWPGNARELRNVIERALILYDVPLLDVVHLGLRPTALPSLFRLPPEGIDLEKLEEQLILQALEMAQGNKTQAARLLGLSRDAFRYRLKTILERRRARGEASEHEHAWESLETP